MATCAWQEDVGSHIRRNRRNVANVAGKKVLRDVKERGRDIEGCIKQWFSFVKPNFHKYVEPQRHVAGQCLLLSSYLTVSESCIDLIVPRGVENKVAISKYFVEEHRVWSSSTHAAQA